MRKTDAILFLAMFFSWFLSTDAFAGTLPDCLAQSPATCVQINSGASANITPTNFAASPTCVSVANSCGHQIMIPDGDAAEWASLQNNHPSCLALGSCSPAPLCGSANGISPQTAPTTNLCNTGTASAVTSTGSGWSWSCSNGGQSTSCATQSYVAQLWAVWNDCQGNYYSQPFYGYNQITPVSGQTYVVSNSYVNAFRVNGVTVQGDGNIVETGQNNYVTVKGNNNTILGGNLVLIYGNNNSSYGGANAVWGDNNSVYGGNNNDMAFGNYNYVSSMHGTQTVIGNNNTACGTGGGGGLIVDGSYNNLLNYANGSAYSYGNYNTLTSEASEARDLYSDGSNNTLIYNGMSNSGVHVNGASNTITNSVNGWGSWTVQLSGTGTYNGVGYSRSDAITPVCGNYYSNSISQFTGGVLSQTAPLARAGLCPLQSQASSVTGSEPGPWFWTCNTLNGAGQISCMVPQNPPSFSYWWYCNYNASYNYTACIVPNVPQGSAAQVEYFGSFTATPVIGSDGFVHYYTTNSPYGNFSDGTAGLN